MTPHSTGLMRTKFVIAKGKKEKITNKLRLRQSQSDYVSLTQTTSAQIHYKYFRLAQTPLDNCRSNLRVVSKSTNHHNAEICGESKYVSTLGHSYKHVEGSSQNTLSRGRNKASL